MQERVKSSSFVPAKQTGNVDGGESLVQYSEHCFLIAYSHIHISYVRHLAARGTQRSGHVSVIRQSQIRKQ